MKINQRILQIWLWFFPVTLAIHIAEEFWGGEGFISWNTRSAGTAFSTVKFFALLSIGFILVLTGVYLARRYNNMRWILSALATIYLINGISHSLSTLFAQRYSPGLISGLLLWIPCCILILISEHRQASKRAFTGGIITGAAIHGVVTLISTGVL